MEKVGMNVEQRIEQLLNSITKYNQLSNADKIMNSHLYDNITDEKAKCLDMLELLGQEVDFGHGDEKNHNGDILNDTEYAAIMAKISEIEDGLNNIGECDLTTLVTQFQALTTYRAQIELYLMKKKMEIIKIK